MPGNHLFYAVDNSAGDLYVCIQAHQSSPASEPGVGALWETYWRLDNSYPGLHAPWIGPVISVKYRPPALVTGFQQNRQNDALIEAWRRRRRQSVVERPYYFGPSRLLNVTTRRMFESTDAPRDDLGVAAAKRLRRHRGYAAGIHAETFFTAPRGARAIPWFSRMADSPRKRRMLRPQTEAVFVSWVHIKGRPPWMGTTVDMGTGSALRAGYDRRRRYVMMRDPLVFCGGIPKYGDKTVTPEESFNVAGV